MRRPSPPARTTPTKAPAADRPEMVESRRLTAMAALCEALRPRPRQSRGGTNGIQHRQGRQLAASGRQGARAVVGWWPDAVRDRRRATGLQGAGRVPEEAGPQAGAAGRLQDRAHLAADPGSRPACGALLRADPQEARVRAQGRPCAPTAGRGSASSSRSSSSWAPTCRAPKGKPYDKDSIAAVRRRGARRLRADRGPRRRLQPAEPSIR